MTHKTRYFLLGSSAMLVAGLCAGLVAYYVGFPTVAFSSPDGPDDLRYVPRDATVVAYANVRDVMGSELRERLRRLNHDADQGQQEFERQTGINIETDIDSVVACLTGAAKVDASSRDDGLVVARGRFDQVRIEGLLRDRGGAAEQYRGKRIFTYSSSRDDHASSRKSRHHPELALSFLSPDLVALGTAPAVRQAVDLLGGGQNVTRNDELMKLVREIDDGNAWAVGRFDVLADRARLPQGITRQLPAITWFAATGRLNGGFSGSVRAEGRDEEAAQNLRDVVRGFMALVKMQAGSKPGLQTMLQSFELSGTGKTVAISFSVPAEVLDVIVPPKEKPAPRQRDENR